jgi:hypothetical protein
VNQGHVENRTAEQGVGEGGASMPWAGGDDEGGKQETMENFGAVDVDIANGKPYILDPTPPDSAWIADSPDPDLIPPSSSILKLNPQAPSMKKLSGRRATA